MTRLPLLPLLFVLALPAAACGKKNEPAPAETPSVADAAATRRLREMERKPVPPKAAAVMAAKQGASMLASTLKSRVQEAMGAGGPVSALDVCSKEAQALTRKIGAARGVRVGRSSDRLRNPANAGPEWVQKWMADFRARPPAEQTIKSHSEVVAEGDGEVARFIKPIKLEAPCLACHGPTDSLAPEVVALLAERYPEDRATGYAAGDIRGVVWAEAPVRPAAAPEAPAAGDPTAPTDPPAPGGDGSAD